MRRLLLLLCLPTALSFADETTAFVNVNVVPMSSETVVAQQTVIIIGDSIVAVGHVDETPIPEDARVVDGTDRYLIPGLAEMHAHVPDAGARATERYLNLYVANGVTTIRGMLGRPSHIVLRADLESGRVFGPRLVTTRVSRLPNSTPWRTQLTSSVFRLPAMSPWPRACQAYSGRASGRSTTSTATSQRSCLPTVPASAVSAVSSTCFSPPR